MAKIFFRNLLIFLALIGLSFPCDHIISYYALVLSLKQFIPIIVYAILCGVSLNLMDLSDKRMNALFAGIYLIFIAVNFRYNIFFVYGPTDYFFVLMFGALLASVFRNK